MPSWYAPLDPDCPKVREVEENMASDPMWAYSGVQGDFMEDFTRRHRAECPRCQEYGAANIEVR